MHLFTCNTTHVSTRPDRFNLSPRYLTTVATCTTVYGQKYRLGVDELLEYNCGGISINTLIVIRITRLVRGLGGGEARAYSIIYINKEHWSCILRFLVLAGGDMPIGRGGGIHSSCSSKRGSLALLRGVQGGNCSMGEVTRNERKEMVSRL